MLALLALVVHFAQPMFQPFSFVTIRRCVGQPLPDIVLTVPKALAMLPPFPTISLLARGLRAEPGYRDLNVGLPRRRALSIERLWDYAREQSHAKGGKADLHRRSSPV
jgi:hypothetical protein